MRLPSFLAAVALVTIPSSRAHAHHVDTHALGFAEPRSSLVLTTEHTTFAFAGERGRYVTQTARGTFAHGGWAFGASLPLHSLVTANERAVGLGDANVGAMFRAFGRGADFGLWVGAAVELPVGNAEKRLANGHLEVVPTIYGAWAIRPAWTILRATVADAISIDAHGHDQPADTHAGSLTSPHGEHEVRYSLALLQYLLSDLFVEVGATAVTRLDHEASGDTLASGQGLVGVAATRGWVITAGYAHTMFGERRFDGRVTFASQIVF